MALDRVSGVALYALCAYCKSHSLNLSGWQQVNITFVDVGFDRERCRNATLDILAGRYGDVRFIVGPYTYVVQHWSV